MGVVQRALEIVGRAVGTRAPQRTAAERLFHRVTGGGIIGGGTRRADFSACPADAATVICVSINIFNYARELKRQHPSASAPCS